MARALWRPALGQLCLPTLLPGLLVACGGPATSDDTDPTPDAPSAIDADPTPDAALPDATPPDAAPSSAVELFNTAGRLFTFDILPSEAATMDNGAWENPIPPTFAEDLTITDIDGTSTSFGKIGLRTVGQSTFKYWSSGVEIGKPNLRIDSNEFQMGLKIGGVEHFRFNNGRVGGLLRETLNYRVWDALGYPTPDSVHAWVKAPQQWGAEYKRPYLLMEVYKESWAKREFGPGMILNGWEGVSSLSYVLQSANRCQWSTCDDTTLQAAADLVGSTPQGANFAANTSSVIDWPAWHEFQCLSWIMGTGDDYTHNGNNLMILETAEGKLRFHPYSSDISAGIQVWGGYYGDVQLQGWSELAAGCQSDPECWADMLVRCDELLTDFEDLDPATTIVQPLIDELNELGMMDVDPYPDDGFLFPMGSVPTDAEDAAFILNWYQNRAATCRAQLDAF